MESFPKIRRGRPAKFDPQLIHHCRSLVRGRSHRSHQSFQYLCRAFEIIKPDADCTWLADINHNRRHTVLTELGRLADLPDGTQAVLLLARFISKAGKLLTAGQALAMIRKVRLGTKP